MTLQNLTCIANKIGSIRELCLCQSGIGDDGLQILIDELRAALTLTKLSLCCNKLGDASAIRLKKLSSNTPIKRPPRERDAGFAVHAVWHKNDTCGEA